MHDHACNAWPLVGHTWSLVIMHDHVLPMHYALLDEHPNNPNDHAMIIRCPSSYFHLLAANDRQPNLAMRCPCIVHMQSRVAMYDASKTQN